jgi:drug/metabolite transporter (DMT)-like permease
MAVFGLEPWMLALLAAGGFACYTVTVEYGMAWTEGEASPVLGAVFVSTVVVTGAFWAFAAARGLPDALTDPGRVWPFVVAGVAYPAVFRFLYYEGIDRVGSSVTAAVLGAYPAVSVLLAVALLDEVLGLFAAAGVSLIVGGVVLLQVTQESADATDVEDVVTGKLAAADARDLLYPAAATLLTGGAFVLIDFGLSGFPDPVAATAVTQTPALVLFTGWALTAGIGSGRLRLRRSVLGAFALAGAFNFVGWLTNFFALQSGSVVTVVPLLNTTPLLVMVITYSAEREVPRSTRLVGAVAAIVVGVTLVQVGT